MIPEASVRPTSSAELELWKQELELRKEQLCRLQASQSLQKYIEYLELCPPPSRHHRLLIEKLEQVVAGDIKRLMVWMPPGSAKSTYASVLFPPYYMGRHETASILGVSNTTELAERFSRRARNIVSSARFRHVFGFGCSEDTKAAGSWENERGGEFFAAGIGSAIAGRRAGLGLIDDPVKSREEADSERVRDKHWDWYLNDFLTRLLPNAPQIIIQTRWHEDDLSGRILEREANRWAVLKLPMEAQGSDPLGRAPGERLWPEWFTDEQVSTAKMDTRAWNALYQQDPAPDEGDYFRREWFNEYRVAPRGMHLYGASDYAVSEGMGDYSEHGIFGLDWTGDLYLVDWWRGQTSSDVWIEKQCDLIAAYSPLIWFGESGPIKKAIEPFLKRRMQERGTLCRLEWLPSIVDKVVRARPFQARAAMGNVYIPMTASWVSDLMGQLMRFPAGKYDDGVDVCSLIGRGLEHAKPPKIEAKPVEEVVYAPAPRHDGLGWMGS
jgi:predicted phage terminase large subunit-like protein